MLARCEIAEAFYLGGDSLALEMLKSASLRLYRLVIDGAISSADLFDNLQDCASNLGMTAIAQNDVQAALAYGPQAYSGAV